VSTETSQPVESVSKSLQRLTRSRVLLGIVGACLLLWSIKAIHHARQPKYAGKTIQQWFAIWQKDFEFTEKYKSVFLSLDEPALKFLWQEYNRKDSGPTTWLMAHHQRLFKIKYWGNNHEMHRRVVAYNAFCRASPDALAPFQPAIVARLKTIEPNYSGGLAYLVGLVPQQPETAVPALLESLRETNRDAGDRIGHLFALGQYGRDAADAVPLLRTMLADTNRHPYERSKLVITILQINGPGPELAYLTNSINSRDYSASISAIYDLKDVGTNAYPALPLLLHLAHNTSNKVVSNSVMEAIRVIDPEGVYQEP